MRWGCGVVPSVIKVYPEAAESSVADLVPGRSGTNVVRTDHEEDEGERAEQRDGVIMPPQFLRVSCKTSVGGDEQGDNKQDDPSI